MMKDKIEKILDNLLEGNYLTSETDKIQAKGEIINLFQSQLKEDMDENEGLKVQMRALSSAITELQKENKALREVFCKCSEDQTTGWIETPACNICGKIIESELITKKNKALIEAESKWISVEDRLPKWGAYYIVCTKRNYITKAYLYEDTKEWWIDGMKITHWQPLPNPPICK